MGIPEGLTPATSAEPARWVIEGLVSREHSVRSLVPDGFEAYCRLFHPASTYEVGPDGRVVNEREVAWAEIAKMNDRVMHPEAQFEAITGLDRYKSDSTMDHGQPPLWRSPANDGSLDRDILELLARLLRSHTQTPDHCHFAYWDGYGGTPRDIKAPVFGYPWPDTGRDHLLFEGPIESCVLSVQPHTFYSVNVWWPEDHAWLVATDIDLDSTYIGGSDACIQAIVEHPEIEALRTEPAHVITRDGDKINPPLSPPVSTPSKKRWFWQR